MISMKELNPHGYPVDSETQDNLNTLLERVNHIRTAWAKPMTVTSGLRSAEDQQRINPSAPKSKHLTGQAVDISDPHLELTAWLKGDGAKLCEQIGLWMEEGNSNWVHFQIVPPKSGRRWFLP